MGLKQYEKLKVDPVKAYRNRFDDKEAKKNYDKGYQRIFGNKRTVITQK